VSEPAPFNDREPVADERAQIETHLGRFRCYNKKAGTLDPIGLLALTKAGPLSIFGRFGNSSRFCYGFAFARIASPYSQIAPLVIPVTIALYRAWTGERYAGQDGREKA
jgi:hypothetical protein